MILIVVGYVTGGVKLKSRVRHSLLDIYTNGGGNNKSDSIGPRLHGRVATSKENHNGIGLARESEVLAKLSVLATSGSILHYSTLSPLPRNRSFTRTTKPEIFLVKRRTRPSPASSAPTKRLMSRLYMLPNARAITVLVKMITL